MVRIRHTLLLVLVPLVALLVLLLGTLRWGEQQQALVVLAEQRRADAQAAEATAQTQAVEAQASLTAIADQQAAVAAATATVVAQAAEPRQALLTALGRLFAAYQDPAGGAYDQLSQYFGPAALSIVRGEADYLRANDLHLGGSSTFTVNSDAPSQTGPDTVTVHTIETWTYDARDQSNTSQRCFSDTSGQTYTLQRTGQSWLVTNVHLEGNPSRKNC